ncbi:MAG: sulfur carrier protein ThiS [Candidatus Thioglobus sp.]
MAIEVNEKIIPKSSHNQYKLLQDDKVEIIVAVGGG